MGSRVTFKAPITSDVAVNGTFTVPYPAGFNQAMLTNAGDGYLALNDNEVYRQGIGVQFTFGASNITVQNTSPIPWPAGTVVNIGLSRTDPRGSHNVVFGTRPSNATQGGGPGRLHDLAQSLIAAYDAATPIATIAVPISPTIGAQNAASPNGRAVGSPLVAITNALFQGVGSRNIAGGTYKRPSYMSQGDAVLANRLEGGNGWGQRFRYAGRYLHINLQRYSGTSMAIEVRIDGKRTSTLPTAFTETGARWVTYDFGSAASRIVEVYFTRNILVSGYDGDSAGAFTAVGDTLLHAETFGDSYANGLAPTPAFFEMCKNNYTGAIAEKFGIVDTVPSGTNGQGWVTVDGAFGKTFVDRIGFQDLSFVGPDIVFMNGSVNDSAANAATLQANVAAGLAAAQIDVPDAFIVFVSTFTASGAVVNAARNAACRDGALSVADSYRTLVIDAFAQGFPTITSGGGDGIHPTFAECQTIAGMIGAIVRPWLATR